MKKWILIISLLMVLSISSLLATVLYDENFTVPPYTLGGAVTGTNGWAAHSGTTFPFTAVSPGLTYTGYQNSGIGLAAQTGTGSGEDINKTFTLTTSGDIYAAFMINYTGAGSNTQDYAVMFGPQTIGTTFAGRIYVQRNAANTNQIRFGISRNSTNTTIIQWTGGTWAAGTYDYAIGTTYLIVLKYTIVPGGTTAPGNDEVRMWINPATGSTEPTPTLVNTTDTVSADPANIGTFALRQSSNTPYGKYDGIRIATTWADIFPATITGSIDTYGTTSLTFTTPVGTPSAAQTYDLEGVDTTTDITITAPANYQLYSDETPAWANSIVVTSAFKTISVRYNPTAPGVETGNITHVAGNANSVNIAVSGTGTTVASIVVNPTSRTFTAVAGTTSAAQSYTLTGSNLTEGIVVTAPAGYSVCDTALGTYASTVTVDAGYNGLIYVKFTPPGFGTYNGNVTNVANGITTNLAVSGTGTGVPMNIAVGTTVTENFNGIGTVAISTLPNDWKADKISTARTLGTYAAAVTATERVGGDALSSTAVNGIYNYGAGPDITATDRAVGFVSSSSATKSGNLYAKMTNTGATAITALEISYNAEKYRTGVNAAGYQIQMYYSLDGTAWTTAGPDFLTAWPADVTTLGYTPAPGDTKAITAALLPVSVPAAASVYLAWNYSVQTGTTTSFAQALGVDDVSVTGRALDIVAVPTFSVTPGIIYTASENVYLSCTTPGASIRYTIDGVTEPTSTVGTLYTTGPITVSSTTTIKAVAYKTAWIESAVATGTYTFPIHVANIAALRAGVANSLTPYKLTGEAILTLQSTVTASKNKYIQDATGAIQIYDPAPYKMTTAYNLGDGITGIYGTLTVYGNMLEFIPLVDAGPATHTSGYVPTPVNVTLAALDATYQAKLIHITNVSIDPLAVSPFAASTNYVITDPSGAGVLRTAYSDLDYIGAAFTTSPMNYTGVCLQYNTAFQLVPRSLADITEAAPPTAPINVTVTVVGDDVHLAWDTVAGASYIVKYATTPNGTFTQLGTSLTNSYVATGDASTYGYRFYQVIAVK